MPHRGGGDKGTAHSYIEVYNNLFKDISDRTLAVLEIGIFAGHSIKMWKEYFFNSKIYGCDIHDKRYLNLEDERTKIIAGDATKSETFKDIEFLDIVIDDGSHILNHQIQSFKILNDKLNNGGIYVIEDVLPHHIDKIQQEFDNCFEVIDMRHLREHLSDNDNILMVYRKNVK